MPHWAFAFSTSVNSGQKEIDDAGNVGISAAKVAAGVVLFGGGSLGAFIMLFAPGEGATKILIRIFGAGLILACAWYGVPRLFNFTL